MLEIFHIIQSFYDQNKHPNRAVIIGINGFDCSGKTYFAESLKKYFTDIGITSEVVDIDDSNVKSIEDSTYESFSKRKFTSKHLETYFNQIIDFKLAYEKVLELRRNYSVVIVEGIFIYKKEFVDLFDFKVFLKTNYQIARERFRLRQKRNNDARPIEIFEKVWIPSHYRYLKEIEPENLSDLVVNNSNYFQPQIMKYHEESMKTRLLRKMR